MTDLIGYFDSPKKLVVFTAKIASTANLAKNSASEPMILEDIEVLATLIKASLPKSDTLIAKLSLINLQASLIANLNPVIMLVGCTLFLIKLSALFKNSAAKMTTLVVPSPTS